MLLQPFFSSSLSTKPLISSPSTSSPPVPSLSSSLSSPSSPSYSTTDPKLPSLIVALLQKRVIPEAEALSSMGHKDDSAVLGARMGVVKVVFSILCLYLDSGESIKVLGRPVQRDDVFGGFSPSAVYGTADMKQLVKWAAGLLCQWYKAGNDMPWRTVLEKTLPQVVSRICFVSVTVLRPILFLNASLDKGWLGQCDSNPYRFTQIYPRRG